MEKITNGYKAFNGYVFTEIDAKLYNDSFFANDEERHRLFCLIIEQQLTQQEG